MKSLACMLASSTADKSGLVALEPIIAAGLDFEMQRERSAAIHLCCKADMLFQLIDMDMAIR